MSVRIVTDASILVPLYGQASTANAVLANPSARMALTEAMAAFRAAIEASGAPAAGSMPRTM